ncbi:MAG TPA: geranylgeranyl reductase family protein [bacterium]|nr:geranylgeranyl reductase family protein [bacterium]
MIGEALDAIVIGAGPGGSAAAYTLAARGVRVLLLDKAVFPREKVCGDGLTPRAVAALHEMGILERLLPLAQSVSEVEVMGPDGAGVRAAVPAPTVPGAVGLPAMLVVPRLRLDDAIRTRAVEAGACFEGGADVEDIARDDGRLAVRATRGGRPVMYSARLAIVATGASIALPRRLGALRRPPAMMLAARTYVTRRDGGEGEGAEGSGMARRGPHVEIRFAGVPLPGYGWIFPTSASTANVGVGYLARRRGRVPVARAACERFMETLEGVGAPGGARAVESIRSYPLRVDFPASRVHADGVLFAGEAAGLVNPLTGEGIDYALESGRIAADHAAAFLSGSDQSPRAFAAAASAYERALRGRFERLFAICRLLRDVSSRTAVLNRLVRVAGRREDLTTALVNIVLGNREPLGPAPMRTALRALLVRG